MKNISLEIFRKKSFLFLLICLSTACSKDQVELEESFEEVNLQLGTPDEIEGQYIVLISNKPVKKDNVAQAALEALQKEIGNMQGARVKGTFKHSITGFVAKLLPEHVDKLRKDKRVLSITADKYIELEETLNTATVSVQEYPVWGLDKLDQRDDFLDRSYAFTATGSEVSVYIMDSGIRYSHRIWRQGFFGYRFSQGIPR